MNGIGTQNTIKNDETISSEHKQIRHAVVVFAQLLPGGASRARSPARRMYRTVPNQNSTWSADFILREKSTYNFLDVTKLSGKASIDTQLLGSIGQTQRVFLNMTTKYSTRRMAGDIKKYFDQNEEALEVVIAIGKKMVSIERDFVSDKHFYANLRKLVEKK